MSSVETLPLLLKQLNLSTMQLLWQEKETEAGEKQWSYSQYLQGLCSEEVARRHQKRINRYTKDSKLPPGKSLASVDFNAISSVTAAQVNAIADNASWVRSANNLILFGPSGVGKTHLAAAVGYRFIEQGIRVVFTSTTALIQKLQEAKTLYKLPEMLNKLSRLPVLILDDIGYANKNEQETSVLFELIAQRYETGSLIITSNKPFAEWDSIFPDNMMTVAAVDRLVHHAMIINVPEKSYRRANSLASQSVKTKDEKHSIMEVNKV